MFILSELWNSESYLLMCYTHFTAFVYVQLQLFEMPVFPSHEMANVSFLWIRQW